MAFMTVQPLSSQLTGIDFTSSSPAVTRSTSAGGASSRPVSFSVSTSISSLQQDSSATTSATSVATQAGISTTSNSSTPSESSSNDSQKQSNIWIIGPVVGPLLLILLLVAIWFWGFRRRRRRARTKPTDPEPQHKFEKPELHADCIIRPISPNPREMSGWTPGHPFFAEKSANEAPAQELPAEEVTPSKGQTNLGPSVQNDPKKSTGVELRDVA